MKAPSGADATAWDYVIVGGGTAGCVVASRLIESPGVRVLVLEAGGLYPGLPLSVPLVGLRAAGLYSWKYVTCPQAGLRDRRIPFPFGKVLGGSSSVNAMMYSRGSARSYDRWRELGNDGWSFADVLPYFRKSENQQRGLSEYHGVGGPIDVSDPIHVAPFSRAFVEACLEIGIPFTDDFNGPQPEGAGFFQVMQRSGRRVNAATAYLAPHRQNSSLSIVTGALVRRLVFDGPRVVGVEFDTVRGGRQVARAERDVILSAGSLDSPKLLMLSGVGPADHVRSFGIRPVLDLPGVGANLQDHVRIPVLYRQGRRSPGAPRYWIPAALEYGLRHRGVLASNLCESGARLRWGSDADDVDLQFVTHFQSALARGVVDLEVSLFRTASRGTVRLASADPAAAPAIDPNYLSDDADLRLAIGGVRFARTLAKTKALQLFPLAEEVAPGAAATTDHEIEGHVRSTATTSFHPVGTCKMGSDSLAVVDTSLRVRGLDGLRVVDASIMPELPNGNTAAPTLMIAERAADLLKEGESRR